MQVNATGFALGQIARALRAAEINLTNRAVSPQAVQKSHQKALEWVKIAEASATYNFGSRTPVPNIPPWVTLKVAAGGFATGELLAEGELLPHEKELLARLPASTESDRARLNAFFLSEQGMLQLHQLLHSGCYRVTVPEEGALLAVAWLLAHDRAADAERLVAAISGFFPRLRFYPCPADAPIPLTSSVCLSTVAELKSSLQCMHTKVPVQTLKAVIRHLRPVQDELEALFLETLPAGAAPPMATRDEHRHTLSVDGPLPCQVWPAGWHARAKGVLDSYAAAVHQFGEPGPRHKALLILVGIARKCIAGQLPTEGEARRLRWLLGESNACRGLPGSSRHAALRQTQERSIQHHCVEQQAQLVLSRLAGIKNVADGLDDVSDILRPANSAEALLYRVPENVAFIKNIYHRVERVRRDDIFRLIESGLVPSAEVLALLVPQVVAQVQANGLGDEPRKQLYAQIYKAFSSRRSLLLLNLEHQVRITELPWVTALQGGAVKTQNARDATREALAQVSMAAIEAFPATILPNKLLKELGQLVNPAGLSDRLPLVEELAVDIFMHAFGRKFVHAGDISASVLENSLYSTYYNIDCNALHALYRARDDQGFYRLCCQRASYVATGHRAYGTPAQNGTIVEQQQILTTHNLAALFRHLGLAERIGARLRGLPRKCFSFVVYQLSALHNFPWRTQLQTIKNCAYAWRQMLFFLSMLPRDEQDAFYGEAQQQVDGMKDAEMRGRLRSVLEGLGQAMHGTAPPVVFLGWCTSRHFLLPPQQQTARK